jgi:hypothetical protein
VKQRPQEFTSWLQTLESDLQYEFTALDGLCRLLGEGQDVRGEDVAAKVASFPRLHELAKRLGLLAKRLGLSGGPGPPPEEKDWSPLRTWAEALLRLLDEHPNGLPGPLRRAISEPDFRARLEAAVKENQTVQSEPLDEGWKFVRSLFERDRPVSVGLVIDQTPLAELRGWLDQRAADADLLR